MSPMLSSETPRSLQRIQTVCLVILTVIAAGFALGYLQSVLLPFVVSLFVVSGVRPILEFLEQKLHLHWFIAFGVTFLVGVALLVGFAFLIWLSINDLAQNATVYQQRIDSIVTMVARQLPGHGAAEPDAGGAEPGVDHPAAPDLGNVIPSEGAEQGGPGSGEADQAGAEAAQGERPSVAEGAINKTSQAMRDLLVMLRSQAQTMLLRTASLLTNLLSYGVLILIFVFFLLLARADGPKVRPPIIADVDQQVRRYIVMKTAISFFTGLTTTLVLWLFGVPLAIVFGMLAFLLNFIPNIGPLIATLLPVPFLVLNPDMSPVAAVICLALLSAVHFVSGNVVETRVMGKSFDISPIALLLGLMLFGLLWGIVGMFLATPIVSVIKIVLYQHESTRPLAELLAGRWTVSAADRAVPA